MPYLSDRPTVCKLLAPQDRGLACVCVWKVQWVLHYGRLCTFWFASVMFFLFFFVRDGTVFATCSVLFSHSSNKSFTNAKH